MRRDVEKITHTCESKFHTCGSKIHTCGSKIHTCKYLIHTSENLIHTCGTNRLTRVKDQGLGTAGRASMGGPRGTTRSALVVSREGVTVYVTRAALKDYVNAIGGGLKQSSTSSKTTAERGASWAGGTPLWAPPPIAACICASAAASHCRMCLFGDHAFVYHATTVSGWDPQIF